MKKIIYIVLLIAAVAVFCFAGYQIFTIQAERNRSMEEYQELSQYVAILPTEALEEEEAGGKEEVKQQEIPNLQIDFDALKAINPEITGWIYMEGIGASYPIAAGKDNEYYLNHTFEGQRNGSGCIFMDYENNSDFTDYNTFVYGHNMKNGTMFGSLKRYVEKEDFIEEYPYFYIYTENSAKKYAICSYYIATPTEEIYHLVGSTEAYAEYQKLVLGKSVKDCGIEVTGQQKMVSLSTCSGNGSKRFLVHGVEVVE